MKKMIILLVILTLAILIWASFYHKNPPESADIIPEGVAPMEYEVWVNGRIFSEEIPQEIQEVIPKLKEKKGYFTFAPQELPGGEEHFILISSGEKRTGGYSLELKDIAVENDILEIIVEEKEPSQEKAVIQVLTYPILLLRVNNDCEHPNIANTAGEAFLPIRLLTH